ncbi:hypothetical protein AVEN_122790-1 [Araneus ventricosus]|uniref:Uncharacterized protein n=1 Tax=Araneus ventricosus TaxID=182803 RepID=A0A4Y2ME11_ARAVE|nr:hypothetical protein AVEN_122790-1 [Araneus ventricosus]
MAGVENGEKLVNQTVTLNSRTYTEKVRENGYLFLQCIRRFNDCYLSWIATAIPKFFLLLCASGSRDRKKKHTSRKCGPRQFLISGVKNEKRTNHICPSEKILFYCHFKSKLGLIRILLKDGLYGGSGFQYSRLVSKGVKQKIKEGIFFGPQFRQPNEIRCLRSKPDIRQKEAPVAWTSSRVRKKLFGNHKGKLRQIQ